MPENGQGRNPGVEELIERRLIEHVAAINALIADRRTVADIAELLVDTFRTGGKLLVFGNGGSAADAQHFVGELVGRLYIERRALPAIALSTNTSNMTAIANDYDYDSVFARQVEALGNPGDVAVGISTSGNSPGIVKGLEAARRTGMKTVAMTGRGGGTIGREADLCLSVDSGDTPRSQEAHISAIHIICEWVEKELAG